MSRENVEIAKRGIDAFNRRDFEAFNSYATEDAEILAALAGAVEGQGFHGRAGIEAYFENAAETWDEFRIIPGDYRDLGDRALMIGRVWGRGKGSRVPVEAPISIIIDFRGEKVCRVRSYFNHAEALRDAAGAEATPGNNVEVVLRWLLAFGSDRDVFSAVTHPEIEWMPFEEGNIPSHGLDDALRLRDQWLAAWDQQSITVEEIWSQGDEVFLAATLVGRGRTSGAEVEIRFYEHCRVRDDKVCYCYEHLGRDEALKALGLGE